MFVDPNPSQQHAGLQHEKFRLLQKVTRPKARSKPTLPEKSEFDVSYFSIACLTMKLKGLCDSWKDYLFFL